jgi:PAS domain S-box-containing protein
MHTLDPSSLRLAAVVESSEDAVISEGLDGRIQTWNRSATRLFGYPTAEAIGASIDIIVPPDRRHEDRDIVARVRRGEDVPHFETEGATKDGGTVQISVAISPICTPEGDVFGISRIARDLTHQRALERQAVRLAAIVDSSADAIVSKDLNGIVQTWNRAAERLFGYTADEIVGRSITLIIPPERRAEEDTMLTRIRAGLSVEHFETVRQRKDGSRVEISLAVSPIRMPAGEIIGASKIARDITAQRQLAREAADAGRVKDEFLAMLSHELRTPLNAVLGYTRMLRSGHMSEDRQERAIDVIERNAHVLSQLVSDVLDVSAIVTGKIQIKSSPCDLAAVMSAAVDVIRPSADTKGLTVHAQIPDDLPAVRCDADRLQQVFWNLLTNAVKFTPRGGRIDVRLEAKGDRVDAIVRDTGIGISADALPLVFQRFWQGENAHRRAGGLGLGLALAHHFVELHGGMIDASSEGAGRGATFTVSLPIEAPADRRSP